MAVKDVSLFTPQTLSLNPARRTQVGRGQKLGEGGEAAPFLLFTPQTLTLNPARRTQVGRGQKLGEGGEAVPFSDMTVEDLLGIVRSLPAEESAVAAISGGLLYLDSRALAALLKELSKIGLANRCGLRAPDGQPTLRHPNPLAVTVAVSVVARTAHGKTHLCETNCCHRPWCNVGAAKQRRAVLLLRQKEHSRAMQPVSAACCSQQRVAES